MKNNILALIIMNVIPVVSYASLEKGNMPRTSFLFPQCKASYSLSPRGAFVFHKSCLHAEKALEKMAKENRNTEELKTFQVCVRNPWLPWLEKCSAVTKEVPCSKAAALLAAIYSATKL